MAMSTTPISYQSSQVEIKKIIPFCFVVTTEWKYPLYKGSSAQTLVSNSISRKTC